MSSVVNPLTSTANTTSSSASASTSTSATDPLGNESTFLTLLVSQLQNQDPLDPTDSNQFVSQLTAFSQLEQLIGINANTTPASTANSGTTNTSTTNTSTTNPTTATGN